MNKTLSEYWPIIILLACFFFGAYSYLPLPSYWDEAWVYLPSVEHLVKNGIDLSPSSLPPELSRGHPLFFHSLFGIWGKIFGLSLVSLRVLSLTLSVLVLIFSYELSKQFFGVKIGVLVTGLIAIQPILFIQSTQILPEMLVSLLTLMTLFFYLNDKWKLYVISASLLLLTKESGVILIVSVFIFELIKSISDKAFSIKIFLLIISPVFPTILFFTLQYYHYGWVFFPDHISMIDFSITNLLSNYYELHDFLFEKSGRLVLFWSSALSIALLWKHAPIWKNILTFILFSTLLKVLFGYWMPIEYLIIPICLILVVILYFQWYSQWKPENVKAKSFFLLSTIFIILYIGFSSVNFFTVRYLLCVIPVIIISQFVLIYSESKYPKFSFFVIAMSIGLSFYFYNEDEKVFDTNINYKDGIEVEKRIVNYIEKNIQNDECVSCGFLDFYIMNNQLAGFRENNKTISAKEYSTKINCNYLIIKNFGDEVDSSLIPLNYSEVYKVEIRKANGTILKIND